MKHRKERSVDDAILFEITATQGLVLDKDGFAEELGKLDKIHKASAIPRSSRLRIQEDLLKEFEAADPSKEVAMIERLKKLFRLFTG